MTDKAIIVQVTVYNKETGVVEQQVVNVYDGSYGYEVERMFERLGESFGKVIEPHHYEGEA